MEGKWKESKTVGVQTHKSTQEQVKSLVHESPGSFKLGKEGLGQAQIGVGELVWGQIGTFSLEIHMGG